MEFAVSVGFCVWGDFVGFGVFVEFGLVCACPRLILAFVCLVSLIFGVLMVRL